MAIEHTQTKQSHETLGIKGVQEEFVADGAISAGNAVVITAAGKVKKSILQLLSENIGSLSEFEPNQTHEIAVAQIGTNKIIAVNKSQVHYIRARVATISGTTFTWGSAVQIYTDGVNFYIKGFDVAPLGTDKAVIVYRSSEAGYNGKAVVATVSGTTITLGGTHYDIDATNGVYNSAPIKVAQLDTDKFIAFYTDNTNWQGTGRVGTVSGTTISWGSSSGYTEYDPQYTGLAAVQLATDKAIVCFTNPESNGYVQARVASVSGTTITWGTTATIDTTDSGLGIGGGGSQFNACQADTDKAVLVWNRAVSPYSTVAVILSVSGTTITVGAIYTAYSVTSFAAAVAKVATGKVTIAYTDESGGTPKDLYIKQAEITGNDLSFGQAAFVHGNDTNEYTMMAQLDAGKAALLSKGYQSLWDDGFAVAFLEEILPTFFAGFATETKSDGQTIKIDMNGINKNQSGLTIAAKYYISKTAQGGITSTPNNYSVGIAAATDKIIIKHLF